MPLKAVLPGQDVSAIAHKAPTDIRPPILAYAAVGNRVQSLHGALDSRASTPEIGSKQVLTVILGARLQVCFSEGTGEDGVNHKYLQAASSPLKGPNTVLPGLRMTVHMLLRAAIV